MINARRTVAAIAFTAFSVLGAVGAASVAQAEPIGPNGPTGGPCPIVNTDSQGNETVTYGKPGDRNGALVCGADGEWTVGKTKANPGQIQIQPGLSRG
ncbi:MULTISPECIES: hypothetical protein [Rhodococcus]|uniref:Secreted protein n=2 Tax=Rhodococcus TaxID=1827 RepID=A0A2S8IP22_RHOOP|nr:MULTISPECIES: hypothetical protein [Rhodococcus]NDV10213.1 hypothetical protein [Rhodococcus sp. IEGM 248]MDI9948854.1 hypothetical protein [Rhodococcus sp. IEGM 1305]MDI9978240.1 hypothetical protein [Rhodococcus sp. IEGM 1307]MDV6284905.1 hypothetical protein [Rhodococcus jostii]PQP16526.1 hypothetical protein C5613_36195 [Rhodococcus opacus]